MTGTLLDPPYLPRQVSAGKHRIGLIGCGWISEAELRAYRNAGLDVAVLCDRTLAKAERRRDEFFPLASVTTLVEDVFADSDIDIVDIATHLDGRPELVARALASGKHVLSQKPFVRDIEEGRSLADSARAAGLVLAVNHNGRWAPHFSAALSSVLRGDLGEVTSADFEVYWPHDLEFEKDPHASTMKDLMLYDFGIHWFDLVAQLLRGAGEPTRVYASTGSRIGQVVSVDTQAEVIIEFERARATIVFRGSSRFAESGSYRVEGTRGVISHRGGSLGGPLVRLDTESGELELELRGDWWANGMTGAMAELVYAIDNGTEASNSADSALQGLALCFAALWSAQTGVPVDPRSVNRAPLSDE